ncbi:MAG: delta-60 repeat domain-containing protein, partial [Syntrophorhabdus sp.]
YDIELQPDGKIIVGGDFTSIDNTRKNRIARLNASGSVDTLFNPDINGTVYSIDIQPDGKIIAGGNFTLVNHGARSRIVRLNPDGSVDPSFVPGF